MFNHENKIIKWFQIIKYILDNPTVLLFIGALFICVILHLILTVPIVFTIFIISLFIPMCIDIMNYLLFNVNHINTF